MSADTQATPGACASRVSALDATLEFLDQVVGALVSGSTNVDSRVISAAPLAGFSAVAFGLDEVKEQLRIANLIALAQSAPMDPQSTLLREEAWRGLVAAAPSELGSRRRTYSMRADITDALGLSDLSPGA